MITLERKIEGAYKIEKFKVAPDGSEIKGSRHTVADWFPNMILNSGLDLMGTSASYISFCSVGSGGTPVQATQTQLQNRIASTTNIASSSTNAQSAEPYFVWRRNVFRFSAGVATGNIAEVGVGVDQNTSLFSRALILDGQGLPTVITVLADESLDISYELRVYMPTADVDGTVMLGGITYAYKARASNVTESDMWRIGQGGTGAYQTIPSQNASYRGPIRGVVFSPEELFSNGGLTESPKAYTPGSYQLDFEFTWPLNVGNTAGGIRSVRLLMGIGSYQIEFTPNIPKTSQNVLSLTFRNSWARRP